MLEMFYLLDFLTRKEDYLLFIDADLEFEPECVIKMLLAQKDIICTPYRAKTNDPRLYKIYG
jgi:glycosyltransferase involved in cell wall biosynthesis